jgi:hypothetical protein
MDVSLMVASVVDPEDGILIELQPVVATRARDSLMHLAPSVMPAKCPFSAASARDKLVSNE